MQSRPDLKINGNGRDGGAAPRLREQREHPLRCPPHRWNCPVVMKVDPRSVAWTCADCGAIATVPVGAPPPASSA